MRFSCQVHSRRGIVIPPDSRRYLLSLVKEAIKRSGPDGERFYEVWYASNRQKPFTFSAYFPLKKRGRDMVLDGDFFRFFFSTSDYEFLMRVYNGFLALKGDFVLFGSPFSIERCRLLPERSFSTHRATFKTLSPFLVRDPEDGDFYLYPEGAPLHTRDEGKTGDHWKVWKKASFDELRSAIEMSLSSLTNQEVKILSLQTEVIPLVHGSGNPDHPYITTYPGLKGEITLEAPPEVLCYLYDVGIGARRSEGFGMLEVVE
ncbi:hypothetical protein BREVNS_1546 [Brevinematales bacterium NS]|nr:CRISPR-associated endoribonuclease Cas6 [Brevinematales bacterium]QJR22296.1 hypothetical protein BREVNS_1546 [Brevinematales bacterium NS]